MVLTIATIASVAGALLGFVQYSSTVAQVSSANLEGLGELVTSEYANAIFNKCCLKPNGATNPVVACGETVDPVCIVNDALKFFVMSHAPFSIFLANFQKTFVICPLL